MAIKRIEITNMAAFDSLVLNDLQGVVLISGGNETGKTSLLDCFRYLADRGHDPDIIHGDAEFGEIIVTFHDGNMARARATRTETVRGWKPAGAKAWKMNRELIDRICTAIGYNPLGFLTLEEKDQVDRFLRIVPAEVPVEELKEAVAGVDEEAAQASFGAGATAYEIIASTHKALYDARRDVNREAETLEKFIARSESLQPPAAPDGEDWSTEAVRIQEEVDKFEDAERARLANIDKSLASRIDQAKHDTRASEATVDDDINAKIKALEEERAKRKAELQAALTESVTDLQKRAAAKQEEIRRENAGNRQTLHAALATAQERARAQQQADGARREIETAKAEAKEKREKWQKLDAALEKLAKVKESLIEKLPIPGVRVEGGRIVQDVEGAALPLKRWNTATKYQFCLRLAMLVNREAGFTVIDDAEHFDPAKFSGLVQTASKYAGKGLQFIIARVTEGPLEVNGKRVQ